MDTPQARPRSALDWIEWLGNKLPEPAILFALLALLVVLVSALGSALDWQVQPVRPVVVDPPAEATVTASEAAGRPTLALVASGAPIEPRSLLSADGIYWMLSSALRNFTTQPALGLIFVAVLGIGIAEKLGFFAALMRFLAFLTPRRWLTPMVVFIGANSAVASDAGYIILPPLAAALFLAMGRHPVAGLAAAFCGVAGGFGGGVFPAGSDGALAGFAQDAARVLDPQPDPNAARAAALLAGQMFSPGYIAVQLSDGSDTLFPGHVREVLPGIRERLRRAADRERDLARKSELEQLAARIDVLLAPRKG